MTTMLSLILAFMLTMGGSPAVSVSPVNSIGPESGVSHDITGKPHLGEFQKNYPVLAKPNAGNPRLVLNLSFQYKKKPLINLNQAFGMNPVNFVDPYGLQEKEFYAMSIANRGDLDRIQYLQAQARKAYAKGAIAAIATAVMSPLSAPTIIALCGSGLIYKGLDEYSDRRMSGQSELESRTGTVVDTLTLGTYPIFSGRDAGTGVTVSGEQKLKIVSDLIPTAIGGAAGIVSGSLFSRLNPSTSQLIDDAFRVLDFQRTSTGYVAVTTGGLQNELALSEYEMNLLRAGASPNEAARRHAQGGYLHPLTNEYVATSETLAADHIIPQVEIKSWANYKLLTDSEKDVVLNLLENFQGLPKTFNSSKGGKLPANWLKYKGQDLHPDYIQRNINIQRDVLNVLNDLINSILANRGG